MNLLYLGKYKQRFKAVIKQLNVLPAGSSVLELCFGDIHVAEFCRNAGFRWQGLDLNEQFIKEAQRRGFNAQKADLQALEVFPRADVCVMMGSLYHFHPHTSRILNKMLKASDWIVISEPVLNLSSGKGIIGFFAKRAANAGKGHETFRYDAASFLTMLENNSHALSFTVDTIEYEGKDIIVKLTKNEKH
jgi:hypothetical protein